VKVHQVVGIALMALAAGLAGGLLLAGRPVEGARFPGSGGGVYLGKPGAPQVMIEVFALDCPHCQRFHEAGADLIREKVGNGALVYYPRPVFLSREVRPLTEAFLCVAAEAPAQAFDFLDAAYARVKVGEFAVPELPQSARACLDSGRGERMARRALVWAQAVGVEATPTFWIDGKRFVGAIPREKLAGLLK